MQERSKSGRIPVKLKLSCKQGGCEQAVRSYTLPFPHAACKQLSATVLGSVDPSQVASAAVHTLIPNLAPRSRYTHAAGSDAAVIIGTCGQLHEAVGQSCAPCGGDGNQVGVAEWADSFGPHQIARQAMFDAVMGLLRPKIGQPVLVNFLSVAGMQDMQHKAQHVLVLHQMCTACAIIA